jgi:short-subunit dehydrogenase
VPPPTQTSLVTGATSGIGLAFSRALAARGDDLVLVARDRVRLDRVAEELRSAYGGEVRIMPADLATDDGTALVADVLRLQAVDLLVNNAGHGTRTSFLDTPVAEEDGSLDLMVRAPMRLCHAALPGMLDRGRGAVLNVASVAAFVPRGTYGAHKAWLVSFTRWLAVRCHRRGVRAMVLCPGFVRTEFHQRMQVDMSSVPGWMWLDADRVVLDALADLSRGVIVSVPSRRYRLLTRLARLTPPAVAERVSRRD